MQSFLKNNRQAPRKVRLIARAMVGKTVPVALSELTYMSNKGAETLAKLIGSAVANAKQANASTQDENLLVKNITVDKGVTLHRSMPRAFGRASPIHKESSHIHVFLSEIEPTKKIEKAVKTLEKKPTSAKAPSSAEATAGKPAGKEVKEVKKETEVQDTKETQEKK